MLRPAYLQPGDTLMLIAPAGIMTLSELKETMLLLKSWGVNPILGRHLSKASNKQLMADDYNRDKIERLDEWQSALNDDNIRAIWCVKGEYGALSIVREADYSIFQGNPKWIMGMDDITVLHTQLYSLGVESIHSFMPANYRNTSPYAVEHVRNLLFGIIPLYHIDNHPFNQEGYAEADITGGRLDWVHYLIDTDISGTLKSNILFIDISPGDLQSIERSILCLKYSGRLQHIAGLIVGDVDDQTPGFRDKAYRVIKMAVEEYDFPICFGFPAGHIKDNFPLILGTNAEFSVTSEGVKLSFK